MTFVARTDQANARVAIGIGSNLEGPEDQVRRAIDHILQQEWFLNGRASSPYKTKPMGPIDQPDYVNAVLIGRSKLSPENLLEELLRIEETAGRVRVERWGPRILDLDILMFSDRIVNIEGLEIPHPGMASRSFVLEPLCEVAPDWLHPITGLTVQDMLNNLQHESE